MQPDLTAPPETQDSNYDHANGRYVFHYDRDGSATLTTTIVHAISTIASVDVSQGEFSLYDSIDPDALERIFSPKSDGTERTGGHISFTALECEVYVFANGDVFVYPPAHP